jgi:hypothetical protein
MIVDPPESSLLELLQRTAGRSEHDKLRGVSSRSRTCDSNSYTRG